MCTESESNTSWLLSDIRIYDEGYQHAIDELGLLRKAPPKILRAQQQSVQRKAEAMFDMDKFLASNNVGPMSTQVTPCPEGTYTAVVSSDGDIRDWFRPIEWKDKKTGEPRRAEAVRIPFLITDDGVRAKLGRETVIVSYDVFLDLNPDDTLATGEGKNVKIGQLRDALGQNGANWNFGQLRGAGPVMVKVSQRSDSRDPQVKYAQIDRVAKVS